MKNGNGIQIVPTSTHDEPTHKELLALAREYLDHPDNQEIQDLLSPEEVVEDRDIGPVLKIEWQNRKEKETKRVQEAMKVKAKKALLDQVRTKNGLVPFRSQEAVKSALAAAANGVSHHPSTSSSSANDGKLVALQKEYGTLLPDVAWESREHMNALRGYLCRLAQETQGHLNDATAPEHREALKDFYKRLQERIEATDAVLARVSGLAHSQQIATRYGLTKWEKPANASREVFQEVENAIAADNKYMRALAIPTAEQAASVKAWKEQAGKRAAAEEAHKEAQRAAEEVEAKARQKVTRQVAAFLVEKAFSTDEADRLGGAIAKLMAKEKIADTMEGVAIFVEKRISEAANRRPEDREEVVKTAIAVGAAIGISEEEIGERVEKKVAKAAQARALEEERRRNHSYGAMKGTGGGKGKPSGEKHRQKQNKTDNKPKNRK